MRQASSSPISLRKLQEGIQFSHCNAAALVTEAKLLREHGHWSRSFALAHFAREELAKVPLLIFASLRVARASTVCWSALRGAFTDHASKWSVVVTEAVRTRRHLGGEDAARLIDELALVGYMGKLVLSGAFDDRVLSGAMAKTARSWGTRRFENLYVGIRRKAFSRCDIPAATAMRAVTLAQQQVQYYEPLLWALPVFLATPPEEAPWHLVIPLHQRLLLAGVGGVIDNRLT